AVQTRGHELRVDRLLVGRDHHQEADATLGQPRLAPLHAPLPLHHLGLREWPHRPIGGKGLVAREEEPARLADDDARRGGDAEGEQRAAVGDHERAAEAETVVPPGLEGARVGHLDGPAQAAHGRRGETAMGGEAGRGQERRGPGARRKRGREGNGGAGGGTAGAEGGRGGGRETKKNWKKGRGLWAPPPTAGGGGRKRGGTPATRPASTTRRRLSTE